MTKQIALITTVTGVTVSLIALVWQICNTQPKPRLATSTIDVIAVTDRSGSFKDKVYLVDQSLGLICGKLDPSDGLVLLRMATTTEVIYESDTMPSPEDLAKAAIEHFQKVKPPKITLPEHALAAILDYIRSHPERKFLVVFIGDGQNDDHSAASEIRIAHVCRELCTNRSVVGIGMLGVDDDLRAQWERNWRSATCPVEVRGTSDARNGLDSLLDGVESFQRRRPI